MLPDRVHYLLFLLSIFPIFFLLFSIFLTPNITVSDRVELSTGSYKYENTRFINPFQHNLVLASLSLLAFTVVLLLVGRSVLLTAKPPAVTFTLTPLIILFTAGFLSFPLDFFIGFIRGNYYSAQSPNLPTYLLTLFFSAISFYFLKKSSSDSTVSTKSIRTLFLSALLLGFHFITSLIFIFFITIATDNPNNVFPTNTAAASFMFLHQPFLLYTFWVAYRLTRRNKTSDALFAIFSNTLALIILCTILVFTYQFALFTPIISFIILIILGRILHTRLSN